MTAAPAALLTIALIAGGIGLAIGLPAWRAWQTRAQAERNTERYLAWRGRADRPSPGPGQGMTITERRRIAVGAALGLLALICLVSGLTSS
jgi:hypothetical protein